MDDHLSVHQALRGKKLQVLQEKIINIPEGITEDNMFWYVQAAKSDMVV